MGNKKNLDDFIKKLHTYCIDGFNFSTLDDRQLQEKMEEFFEETLTHLREQREFIAYLKTVNEQLTKEVNTPKFITKNEPNEELVDLLVRSKALLSRFTYDSSCGLEFKKQASQWTKEAKETLAKYQTESKSA